MDFSYTIASVRSCCSAHSRVRQLLKIAFLTLVLIPSAIPGAVTPPERTQSVRKQRPAALSLISNAPRSVKSKPSAFFSNPAYESKIAPQLARTLRRLRSAGGPQALPSGAGSAADNPGVLFIRAAEGVPPGRIEDLLQKAGAGIRQARRSSFKARLPLAAIESIAALPEIHSIRTLLPPGKKAVTSEGVAATQAALWHSYGFTGTGAKVAIVDTGFLNLTFSQSVNEIPANVIKVNFSSEPDIEDDTDPHGTACAEIVHDMAPDAQLYLIKIDDVTDLIDVKDYCIAQGIDIISCSMGWDLLNFHDGIAYDNWYTYPEDHPVTAVNQADAAGIFCAFAAGNEQEQQSLISWGSSSDYLIWSSNGEDLNLLYNYEGGTIIPAGQSLYIGMTWNQWPLTSNDFDLYLFRNNGSTWESVAGSTEIQDGSSTSYPVEEIVYETPSAGEYAVGVVLYQNSSAPTFILRYYGTPYPYWWGYDSYSELAPGSISIPGDAASCYTVGALDFSAYTSGPIEYYSSLGPNNRAYTGGTAVTKPDICAPVGIDTRSYSDPFFGTSAATPHVAGLAALIKGVYPSYSAAEIRAYIDAHGFDLGAAGRDNTYGSGAALLPAALPATVTLSNLIHDYDGTAQAATATTLPAGLAVDLTYNGLPTGPIMLGSYLVTAAINAPPFYGSATNTLTIVIDPAIESGALSITALTTPSGSLTLQFTGIPGGTYSVMTRTALTSDSWQPIGSIILDSNGSAAFTDTDPPPGSRFYRLQK